MELRQLRYFAVVAEELNFGRAAARLLISGPSLSQQIRALERDLGVTLFERDRRSVALTSAGASLLPDTYALLSQAEQLRGQAGRLSGSEPVRLGYVHWLPAHLASRTSGVARVHIDAWVAPSHTQAARVSDGSLDLAVCWVPTADLQRLGLRARLLGADRLYAVGHDDAAGEVAAWDTVVLLDSDTTAWASWNAYAEQLARDTGASTARISDGGITGPAFHDHAQGSPKALVNSPKGQNEPLPPGLVRRPVVAPQIYWTWSLVWRADEARAAVLGVVEALCEGIGDLGIHSPDAWLPADDPHRQ